MRIYINDKQVDVVQYDDSISILQKWASMNKDVLPEYLRIVNEDFQLEEDLHLTILDIRQEFGRVKIGDLVNEVYLKEIMSLYPKVNRKELVLLMLWKEYGAFNNQTSKRFLETSMDLEEADLRKIDSKIFPATQNNLELFRDYATHIADERVLLLRSLKDKDEIIRVLNNNKTYPCGDFVLEEITSLYTMAVPNGTSLMDIFDSMNVSRDIPFIHLLNEGKNWYKTYYHITPPNSWITNTPLKDGIRFKILSVPYSKLCSRGRFESLYSNGVWRKNNKIEISYNVDVEIGEELIKEKLFQSVGDRLDYTIIREEQLSVRGKYIVDDFAFNKAVFADMIDNSSTLSYFLFLNERHQDSKGEYRSAITKKRFMFYYQPNQSGDIADSLTITITPHSSLDGERHQWIDVRVSRAINRQQAVAFQTVFSKLLAVYLHDYQTVIDEYAILLPSSTILFKKYAKKFDSEEKADMKSGKRLLALKTARPSIFRSGYASMCQPKDHQPYIVTSAKKAQEIRDRFGEHKTMEFKDPITGQVDTYACQPREPGEIRTHIYPGLRKTSKKYAKYHEEVPLVPCCFTEDHYTKTGAILRKSLQAEDRKRAKEVDAGDIKQVLASNKSVPYSRFGRLPFYIRSVVKNAGYKELEKGKQSILPILRYGVIESPDSFLHCLEKAFNARYSSLGKTGMINAVNNVREKMALIDSSVARQELYDYSDNAIRNMLLEKESYLDPGMWVRLAELYYKCNIFIYQISEKYPNGAVVIPRFSQAHLLSAIPEDLPTVFVIKYAAERYPYQCELLVRYNPNSDHSKRLVYVFKDDRLVTEAIKVLYKSNSVSVVTQDGSSFYTPVQITGDLYEGVESQYIDDNGKVRMLKYKSGVCLMTSPLPPLNIPINKEIFEIDIATAIKFIKKKNLRVVAQDGDQRDRTIRGLWVNNTERSIYYGYIPIYARENNAIEGYSFVNPTVNDPLRASENSDLKRMQTSRKIADFLKQYTLFEYSLDQKGFGRDKYTVLADHNYDICSLEKRLIRDNKIMYSNNKLVAPSEDVITRLLSFLNVQLINDRAGVMAYKDLVVVKDYYRTLSDFRKSPQQLVFLNRSSLVRWKFEKSRTTNQNTVIYDIRPKISEPYFYKNFNIAKGKLALIQNVIDGCLGRALGVAEKWTKDRVNSGYRCEMLPENVSVNYTMYTKDGENEIVLGDHGEVNVDIIMYPNGEHAALLFI